MEEKRHIGSAAAGPSLKEEPQKREYKYAKFKEFGLGQLTKHNVELLKILNLSTLPVTYSEIFYTNALKASQYCRFAYYGDVMIGAICCRADPVEVTVSTAKKGPELKSLHILTLSVLKPYRRLGVASELLAYILDLVSVRSGKANFPMKFIEATLRVWSENEEGLRFYESFGFQRGPLIENYYDEIEPPHAYLLSLPLPYYYEGSEPNTVPTIGHEAYDVTLHNVPLQA